ncbi:MAG: 50S ribosomal protein L4 [Candidatus Niyogibacteria bacterium]|nr:50S ribosomal protein L4 [Candidatus Niyogibacteria bacterium]
MKAELYNQNGGKEGTIDVPESIFGLPWNPDLIHQVIVSLMANRRAATAHSKGRGEVRGGGKKPWRQKGTGRARHGSIRSPLWIGGGVTHGPLKEKIYDKKINKKMKNKALLVSFSKKTADKEIIFLNDLKFKEAKTKEAHNIFSALKKIKGFEKLGERGGRTLALLAKAAGDPIRAIKNLPQVEAREARNINALDILSYKYLVIPKETVKAIQEKFIRLNK